MTFKSRVSFSPVLNRLFEPPLLLATYQAVQQHRYHLKAREPVRTYEE
jgi:hypothetical protein